MPNVVARHLKLKCREPVFLLNLGYLLLKRVDIASIKDHLGKVCVKFLLLCALKKHVLWCFMQAEFLCVENRFAGPDEIKSFTHFMQ